MAPEAEKGSKASSFVSPTNPQRRQNLLRERVLQHWLSHGGSCSFLGSIRLSSTWCSHSPVQRPGTNIETWPSLSCKNSCSYSLSLPNPFLVTAKMWTLPLSITFVLINESLKRALSSERKFTLHGVRGTHYLYITWNVCILYCFANLIFCESILKKKKKAFQFDVPNSQLSGRQDFHSLARRWSSLGALLPNSSVWKEIA